MKATTDRVLARLPLRQSDATMIGGIIIPNPETLNKKNPVIELDVLAAGPDCKTVRAGDRVIVNRNVCSPLEWHGAEYMVFSEVSVIAVLDRPTKEEAAPEPQKPLTAAEINAHFTAKEKNELQAEKEDIPVPGLPRTAVTPANDQPAAH